MLNLLKMNYAVLVTAVLIFTGLAFSQENEWKTLADGLDMGLFRTEEAAEYGDSAIVVLRIDPAIWEIKLLHISGQAGTKPLSARRWCEQFNLVAAINAGMFATDSRTHVGYMRAGKHVNSAGVNHYQSVAAFHPTTSELPIFRMFDLDVISLDSIKANYTDLVQNLRLISRPGRNRWVNQSSSWSEAALGEDVYGRLLFIYSRTPYAMHELNEMLLSLPLDLVCAQHLEGGTEAQFYLHVNDTELEFSGPAESTHDGYNLFSWPIPNVIGIARK